MCKRAAVALLQTPRRKDIYICLEKRHLQLLEEQVSVTAIVCDASLKHCIAICLCAFCTDDVRLSCPLPYSGFRTLWAATRSGNSILLGGPVHAHAHRTETQVHEIIPSLWDLIIFSALCNPALLLFISTDEGPLCGFYHSLILKYCTGTASGHV